MVLLLVVELLYVLLQLLFSSVAHLAASTLARPVNRADSWQLRILTSHKMHVIVQLVSLAGNLPVSFDVSLCLGTILGANGVLRVLHYGTIRSSSHTHIMHSHMRMHSNAKECAKTTGLIFYRNKIVDLAISHMPAMWEWAHVHVLCVSIPMHMQLCIITSLCWPMHKYIHNFINYILLFVQVHSCSNTPAGIPSCCSLAIVPWGSPWSFFLLWSKATV